MVFYITFNNISVKSLDINKTVYKTNVYFNEIISIFLHRILTFLPYITCTYTNEAKQCITITHKIYSKWVFGA